MPFLETSAKSADNIDNLFEQLAKTLRDTHMHKGVKQGSGGAAQSLKSSTVQVQKPHPEKSGGGGGGCCWSCCLCVTVFLINRKKKINNNKPIDIINYYRENEREQSML